MLVLLSSQLLCYASIAGKAADSYNLPQDVKLSVLLSLPRNDCFISLHC